MDADSLDLCISCGSHVADGTPYCSLRCQNQDQSVFYPSPSAYASSSSQRYFPSASTSSAAYRYNPHRRPLLDLQEPQQPSLSSEDISYIPPSAHKLESIAEWAKGVWGDAGEDEDEDVLRMRIRKTTQPTPIPTKKSASSSAKSSPSRSSHRSQGSLSSYTPPRFTLTAQHLAPPAMSIATTSNIDDDLSSIRTPSSRASSRKSTSPKKDMVDPWISSPPYEFAYTHFQATQRTSPSALHLQERGRTLVRV